MDIKSRYFIALTCIYGVHFSLCCVVWLNTDYQGYHEEVSDDVFVKGTRARRFKRERKKKLHMIKGIHMKKNIGLIRHY